MATRMRLVMATALFTGVMTTGATLLATSSAGAAGPASYTCSGGTPFSPTMIPAGTYHSVTVTGDCAMQGTYTITGGLTVASGAELDAAVFFGFYGYGAPCDVFVTVSGGISVQSGGVLYLGNASDTGGCPNSNDVVNGGLRSSGGDTIVVHGTTINGGFSANGGGGARGCAPTGSTPFGSYTNIESSQVNGLTSVSNLNTCWIGIIGSQLNGGLQINNNETSDTDAIEAGLNSIHGGMACAGNFLSPAVPPDTNPADHAPNGSVTNFFDGFGPFPNTVTGAETGQCAGL
jgi:hypothetical protein